MEFKSYRIVNGKPKWVVVDENEKVINKEPNKEELKVLKINRKRKHNETNTCDRCRMEGVETKLFTKNSFREFIGEKWTGNWLCIKCYNKNREKLTDSYSNLIKKMRNHRIGNLDPNCSSAKGDRFQLLTCMWRSTISTVPVEDLNKKLDNYNSPLDHSIDSELGIIQTCGKFYDPIRKGWRFGNLSREWDKEFDYEICYCVSENGNNIEIICIIPKEEIIKRIGIGIVKNPTIGRYKSSCIPWYDKYMIKDDETIKMVNKIWKTIIGVI